MPPEPGTIPLQPFHAAADACEVRPHSHFVAGKRPQNSAEGCDSCGAPQSDAEAGERRMKRLIAVAASHGEGRAIVREVGDHAFVVLRIPSRCAEERIEFRVRKVAKSFETNGIGGHDGDANGCAGWTRAGSEEKQCGR